MSTEPKPDQPAGPADNLVDFPSNPDAARSLAGNPATVPDQPAAELTELEKATMAWAGLTLAYFELRNRCRALIANAQVHAPTAGKRNARILVFADRLQDLSELLGDAPPPTAAEAVTFWQNREQQTEEVAELRRMSYRLNGIVQRLETQAGIEPREDKTPDLVKLEGMAGALIDIVQQQVRLIGELKGQLNAAGKN